MKPVGHWYVRKERRGLVCLVIDNRHAVERLKQLEDLDAQKDLDSEDCEQPLALADIFPISTSKQKRGQSPERKFVVAFRNSTRRSDDEDRHFREPDNGLLSPSPKRLNGDKFFLPFARRENKNDEDLCIDSDEPNIGDNFSPVSTRMARARTRKLEDQATSRLILDVIPHEETDRTFKSAQHLSLSTLLEAKAEDTIDTLLHRWTYVDPKYFSEDDRESISSTEPSLPSFNNKNSPSSRGREKVHAAESLLSPHGISKRRRADNLDEDSLIKDLDDGQSRSLQAKNIPSSPSAMGQKREARKRPDPLSPTLGTAQHVPEAMIKRKSPGQDDQELQNPEEPSTPAPPYISNNPKQCSSCEIASACAPSSSKDNCIRQTSDAPVGEIKIETATDSYMDSAIRLFETKILDILKRSSAQDRVLDTQSRATTEQQQESPQHTSIGEEISPVILKDCLGRRFLFPFQKCREWQVSSPGIG